MKHKCKVTATDKKLFPEFQKDYLADPESGPCPCFEVGQEYLFGREAGKDDFYHLGRELNQCEMFSFRQRKATIVPYRYATPSRVPLAMTSFRASCSLPKRSLGSSEPNPAA